MSDMFEYLDAQAREENLPFKNAAAVAIDRSERRFGSFVSAAQGEREFKSRIALVESEVYKIAAAVCEEYGYEDSMHIAKLALGQLEALAADVETGDNYQQERQNLPTAPEDGQLTEPSPKIDMGKAGDQNSHNQQPIDVGSVRNQLDNQTATEFNYPWDGDISDSSALRNTVDADSPMQPEFNVGENTKTFPNKGQADPVTSKVAAEQLNFESLSELMTPSDAIEHLKEAGLPEHEAKDRVDFYVNHVDPGWAHKSWTSKVEKESLWDQTDPTLLDMSYQVGDLDVDQVRALFDQYRNSESFETPQDVVNNIFAMYAENASADQIKNIAQVIGEATGMMPNNIAQVVQHANRFAATKTADHVGVYRDILNMIEDVRSRGGLTDKQMADLNKTYDDVYGQYEEALAGRGAEAGIDEDELANTSYDGPRPAADDFEQQMLDEAGADIEGGTPVGIDPETGGPRIVMNPTNRGESTPPGEKNRRKPLIGDQAFNNVAKSFYKKLAEDQ